MQFKSFMEALKGNQHKLDKNKNGKVDAHDFKLLRKEEEEVEESVDRVARADYKVGDSGRKSHKEITFKDGSESDEKEEVKEAKMSDSDMAERERIVKGMKKNIAGFKSKYGDRAKEVMYATATKQAMKEETIDEAVGHTIEAHGVKGMKGTPWRKTFKSVDHMNDWADKNDSVEVHGTRELESSKKAKPSSNVKEEAELTEWKVKHDGVDQNHPDEAARKLFVGKKNVTNYMTKYKNSAESRADHLKKKGFKNVRIEESSVEDLEELDEAKDMMKVAKDIEAYAAKWGGIDKVDMMKVASMIKRGDTKGATKYTLTLDTDPKEWLMTKMGLAEEAKDLEERNKQNALMRKTMDASRGARYKLNNPVPPAEPEQKTAQAHNKAIGRALRSEQSQQEETMSNMENYLAAIEGKADFNTSVQENKSLPFDPDTKSNFKKPINAKRSPMDTARALAQRGIAASKLDQTAKTKMKEDLELDEDQLDELSVNKMLNYRAAATKQIAGTPTSEKDAKRKAGIGASGTKIKAALKKEEVEEIDELNKATLGSYVKKAKGSIIGGAQVMGMGSKMTGQNTQDKAEAQVRKRASGINKAVDRLTREDTDFDDEGNLVSEKLSFSDFIDKLNEQLLEYETKGGVYRHKGSYGSAYQGDDDEEDDKPKKVAAPDAPKRGRGRPAGFTGASYKPRSTETKAAAAAKAAATKAANKK